MTDEEIRKLIANLEARLRAGEFPVVQHARQHKAGGLDRVAPEAVGGPPSGAAGGELTGTYPNPTVVATHSGTPHSDYVPLASANYVDLTDGGATTLHSHAGGSGHTIRENGTDQTARTGLNFVDADAGAGLITDDAGGNETEVNLSLYRLESADHTHASTGLQGGIIYGEMRITVETPSASEDIIMGKVTEAVTITAISAIVIGGTSVTINPKHGTTVAGTDLVLTAPEVVASASTNGEHINGTGTAMATTLSDVTLVAGEILRLVTTAISGVPTALHVTIQYRRT